MRVEALGIAALIATGMFGCSSKGDVDIGDDRGVRLGASLTDYAGTWEGYAEAYLFSDRTDRVRLTLDSEGNGSLELGDDKPPLSIDPEAGPPGWDSPGPFGNAPDYLTGYRYTVAGAMVEGTRVKLTTQTPDEYKQWCALQTPVLDTAATEPTYRCLPSEGLHQHTTETCFFGSSHVEGVSEVEVPCGKFICVFACTCTATGCDYSPRVEFGLDGALENDGDALVGTLVTRNSRVTIRLAKQ